MYIVIKMGYKKNSTEVPEHTFQSVKSFLPCAKRYLCTVHHVFIFVFFPSKI